MVFNFEVVDRIEGHLGRNLKNRELSAVLTYMEGGVSSVGMDYQEACEIVCALAKQYELPQFC